MGNIVCATRIGDLSRIIQRKAIELAKSQNDKLIFVYVVNLDNLGEIEPHVQGLEAIWVPPRCGGSSVCPLGDCLA